MKVEYKTTMDVAGEPAIFQEVRRAPCCDAMEEAYNDEDYISFGHGEECESQSPVVAIEIVEADYYGVGTTRHHPIKFCPFCGAKIVCEEVERVKVVETRTPVERREEMVWRREP